MPAMTIDLTDEELADLRAAARDAHVTPERLAYDVLVERVVRARQKRRFVVGTTRRARLFLSEFEREFPEGLR